jgi:hypothetical protein
MFSKGCLLVSFLKFSRLTPYLVHVIANYPFCL